MERLTYKNYIEEYEVNFEKSSDKNWSIAESDTHIKVTGEPIDKLGQLEDVLEKYGIESVEELDERLKNAIVPRFNIGQEVWVVLDDGVAKDVVENNWFLCSLEKSRLGLYEDYLFATEEEAIKRLEELKGE